jgi:hypothetical protein
MSEFYKNKTNFSFIFDNEEFPFIFEEFQYDRIFPILKLNEINCVYLSKETQFKFYKKKTSKAAIAMITKDEHINKNKTVEIINFLLKNSGIIDPEI